jgi:molybdate transport system substrate-binding protein
MNDWIQRRRFRRTSIAMLMVSALAAMLPATRVRAANRPLIFAAASLKPALDEILASPAAQALGAPRASYAASSQLARQIEHGAPAALFISADTDWMDVLDRDGLLEPGTRSNLLGNALVLVAPRASEVRLAIAPGFDLVGALGTGGRLALAEPRSVPAGKYAHAALATLGVWDAVEPRIIAADNVRAALNFVVRREAPLGIVYRSDAVSEPAVRVVDTFPAESHAPIVYPVALVAGYATPAAHRLLALLHGTEARAVFERWGFDVLAEGIAADSARCTSITAEAGSCKMAHSVASFRCNAFHDAAKPTLAGTDVPVVILRDRRSM